ncbi:MAG: nitroreductase family protein [Candidatus Omnitrophica bacterium]|nr:nitroreductase family protein [Candidatus Omnitrophota bacterium]
MEGIYRVIIQRRIRRFKKRSIALNLLKKMVNCARLAPLARNLQTIEYIIVNNKELCSQFFSYLKGAAYISPQGDLPLDKRPVAYIAILVDMKKADQKYFAYDVGAAVENILLFAWSKDIGSCWMHSIERENIAFLLKVPSHIRVDSIISLGYKDEKPQIEKFIDSPKYWKDNFRVLHVSKRSLEEIIHYNYYRNISRR